MTLLQIFVDDLEIIMERAVPDKYQQYKGLPCIGKQMVRNYALCIFADEKVERYIQENKLEELKEYLIVEDLVPPMFDPIMSGLISRGIARDPLVKERALGMCKMLASINKALKPC